MKYSVYELSSWLGMPIKVAVNGNHLTVRRLLTHSIAYADLQDVIVQKTMLRSVLKFVKKDGTIKKFYDGDIDKLYEIQETVLEKMFIVPFGPFFPPKDDQKETE